jgi:hypothetical protein
MIEAIDTLVDRYYEDRIELNDNQWLVLTRLKNYRGFDKDAVLISVEDLELGTRVDMAKYFSARWHFPVPQMESLFWQSVKSNWTSFQEMFNRLRKPIPNSTMLEYRIRAKQIQRAMVLAETSPEVIIKSDKL